MIARAAGLLLGRELDPPEPLPPGVVVRQCRWLPSIGGRLSGMRRPAAAVALGPLIAVHPATQLTVRLLRHELAHVAQWRERPLTFGFRYLWCHFRYGYAANPYEVEARHAERRKDT